MTVPTCLVRQAQEQQIDALIKEHDEAQEVLAVKFRNRTKHEDTKAQFDAFCKAGDELKAHYSDLMARLLVNICYVYQPGQTWISPHAFGDGRPWRVTLGKPSLYKSSSRAGGLIFAGCDIQVAVDFGEATLEQDT